MTMLMALLFLALGAAAGTAHFAAIAKDADLLVRGGSAWATIGLRLGRLLLTVAALLIAARSGWQMLLAAALGFMAARQAVLGRARVAP